MADKNNVSIQDIRSVKDIELNLFAIASKLGEKDPNRINEIRRELEIELGFSQHEHLKFSDSLEDFQGLSEQQIEDATQRGMNNPIEIIPKEITKDVEATTRRFRDTQPQVSDTLPDNNSRRTAQQREKPGNTPSKRPGVPKQRRNNRKVNRNN